MQQNKLPKKKKKANQRQVQAQKTLSGTNRKNNPNPLQTHIKEKTHYHLILPGQHYFETIPRAGDYKNWKLLTSVKQRCENPNKSVIHSLGEIKQLLQVETR